MPLSSINRDENGDAAGGFVWTGTQIDGSSSGVDCQGWTGTAGQGTRGWTIPNISDWTFEASADCTNSYRIYCFQQ